MNVFLQTPPFSFQRLFNGSHFFFFFPFYFLHIRTSWQRWGCHWYAQTTPADSPPRIPLGDYTLPAPHSGDSATVNRALGSVPCAQNDRALQWLNTAARRRVQNSRTAANTIISHAFVCGFYGFLQGLRNCHRADLSGLLLLCGGQLLGHVGHELQTNLLDFRKRKCHSRWQKENAGHWRTLVCVGSF